MDMQTKGGIDLGILHHPGVDHRLGATRGRFLGRLEQELHRPRELVAPLLKQARHAQQHRRVRVVATGMHDPGFCEPYSTSFSSRIGKASMSARKRTVFPSPPLPADQSRHAGLAIPVRTSSTPSARRRSATMPAVRSS